MGLSDLPPDVQALRARLRRLMVASGVITALGLAALIAYFAWRQTWGMAAFAVAMAVMGVLQVRFILSIRKGG